ncbi:MAG: hypothetical protein MUE44_07015 [Oscillatoriaceae cyanobacterium Prado104]|nr:hypothetical protein [Oscillatoriaceae cyanobacterium Prado104]
MKNTAQSRSLTKQKITIHEIIDSSGIAAVIRPIYNQSSYLILPVRVPPILDRARSPVETRTQNLKLSKKNQLIG